MSAAVLVPLSQINLNGGVLPPSAITQQQSPRHGRSRGASVAKGKNSRGRGYSLVDDRQTQVSKAVVFVLKRTTQDGKEEEGSDDGKVVADAEGWVGVEDVLAHSKVSALGVSLSELRDVVASAAGKGRLSLRQVPGAKADADSPASYEIRRASGPANAAHEVLSSPSPVWPQVTAADADSLPEFVVHETSYPKYHLILTSGSIKRAGGQPYLSFTPVDGDSEASSKADVSIWIDLKAAMAANPESVWRRTEAGAFVTSDEIPKALWTKAVARRGDLGVLFEDGEVRKEVPVGLRGKGAKAKKGKGVLKSRSGDDDGSGSASDE